MYTNTSQAVIPGVPIQAQTIPQMPSAGPPFSPAGTLAVTLTVASAFSIGSNMVDVKNGSMTTGQAIVNGLAKGVATSVILAATTRSTVGQVALAAGVLFGTGYLVDSAMKKDREELCSIDK